MTTSPSHVTRSAPSLPQLLGLAYGHQRDLELAEEAAVDQLAAGLVERAGRLAMAEDRADRTSPKLSADQLAVLARLQAGQIDRGELRQSDAALFCVVRSYAGLASEKHDLRRGREDKMATSLWTFVVQRLLAVFQQPVRDLDLPDGEWTVFEARLRHYCGHHNLHALAEPDAFSVEIARLEQAGFANTLYAELVERYAAECAAWGRAEVGGCEGTQQGWLKVKEAAEVLVEDPGIELPPNRAKAMKRAAARVSLACSRGQVKTNDKKGRRRRIDPVSLDSWILKQRNKSLRRAN